MDGQRLKIFAPAKINLHLEVLGKGPHGLHRLQSIMQSIDLGDELLVECSEIRPSGESEAAGLPQIEFTCSDPELPTDENNLVVRAARAWLAVSDKNWALRLHLEKRIPIAAGLGGGSSDAAALLLALQHLAGPSALPEDALGALAFDLGSDVPFCLHGGTALVTGEGEDVHPCPALPIYPLLLGMVHKKSSTAEAYAALDQERAGLRPLPFSLASLSSTLKADPQEFAELYINDFLDIQLAAHPDELPLLEALLQSESFYANLSGSGPTYFALFTDEKSRDAVLASLEQKFRGVEFRKASLLPHGPQFLPM